MAKFKVPNPMVNKQLYICVIVITTSFFSCNNSVDKKTEPTQPKTEETVICELIKSRVMLEDTTFKFGITRDTAWTAFYKTKDTSRVKNFPTDMNQMTLWEYEEYYRSFYSHFQNDKVIITDTLFNIKKDYLAKTELFKICDSVQFTDEPNSPAKWMCDSTSRLVGIKALDFYERWYCNKENGNIRKEVMAYATIAFNYKVEKFLPFFFVFRDKESYELIKSKIQRKK